MNLLKELRTWCSSSYNEGSKEQLDYYINPAACNIGDTAYLYDYDSGNFIKLEILHSVLRSNNTEKYDNFDENILIYGEEKYKADTSAEFITNNDSMLVWFRYVD